MKWLNAKVFIVIETLIILILPILNMVFKFWDIGVLASFLIALISLIIAHHSYFLAKGTIDVQNRFKTSNEKLNCIIGLRNIYSYIIIERLERARERNPKYGNKVKKSISPEFILCKIHLMFSNELYICVKDYIDMLYVFDHRNPWAEGTKDENALKDFRKCIDLLESAMCNEINDSNKNKSLIEEYHKYYKNLLNWEKRGE